MGTDDGPAFKDKLPERLGPYTLVRELGRGATGVVWLARQPELARDVAIKILFPELTFQEKFVERFQREAKVAASLRHPHIVQVHDANIQGVFYYIAMEYLGANTLRELIAEAPGPQEPVDAVNLANQILDALGHAHDNGIIHRDVKPTNVMVREPGKQLVLTDFSIARMQEGSALTQTGMVLGTPEYMAPEQFDSSQVDARADLYSVGVILFEMLTGKKAFQGSTPLKIMKAKFLNEPPKPEGPGIPPALTKAVARSLLPSADDRFATAREMREALLAALNAPADEPETPAAFSVRKPKPPASSPALPPLPQIAPVTWEGLIRQGLGRCRTEPLLAVSNLLYALRSVENDPMRASLTHFGVGVAYHHAHDGAASHAAFTRASEIWKRQTWEDFPSAHCELVITALEAGGLTQEATFLREACQRRKADPAVAAPVESPYPPPVVKVEPPPPPPPNRWPVVGAGIALVVVVVLLWAWLGRGDPQARVTADGLNLRLRCERQRLEVTVENPSGKPAKLDAHWQVAVTAAGQPQPLWRSPKAPLKGALKPHESKALTVSWPGEDERGAPLKAGDYVATAELQGHPKARLQCRFPWSP